MTKTITKTTLAALALTLSGTAMAATDGDLGTTSTGGFLASVNVAENTDNHVQIIGLEDLNFPNFTANSGPVQQAGIYHYFCINKNTPGAATLTVDKPEIELSATLFNDPIFYSNELVNGINKIPFFFGIIDTKNNMQLIANNNIFTIPQTTKSTGEGSCNIDSGDGVAFVFDGRISSLGSNLTTVSGNYSNTFTLTVAVQ